MLSYRLQKFYIDNLSDQIAPILTSKLQPFATYNSAVWEWERNEQLQHHTHESPRLTKTTLKSTTLRNFIVARLDNYQQRKLPDISSP